MLQFMGLQRVGHDSVTEHHHHHLEKAPGTPGENSLSALTGDGARCTDLSPHCCPWSPACTRFPLLVLVPALPHPRGDDAGKGLRSSGQRLHWTHSGFCLCWETLPIPFILGFQLQGKCIIFSLKIHFGTDSLQRCN